MSRSYERTAALYRLTMAHPGGTSLLYQSVLCPVLSPYVLIDASDP